MSTLMPTGLMPTGRALVAVAALCAGCHHDQPTRTLPPPIATAAPAPAPAAPAPAPPVPVSAGVSVDSELAARCKLQIAAAERAPRFDFDQAALTAEDRDVLVQVARCVTEGPLKGRRLALVGRADPRGTEEYNLALGDRRAHAVSEYLARLGVSELRTSTRGALDATGHDETTWRTDRRVDLVLE